jgi:hypothetical protein
MCVVKNFFAISDVSRDESKPPSQRLTCRMSGNRRKRQPQSTGQRSATVQVKSEETVKSRNRQDPRGRVRWFHA